jgi:S1-C subfamily serine protease
VIAAAVLTMLAHEPATARQQNLRQPQGPDLLLLQGPGSDIGASVREFRAADQRPQGRDGVVIEQVTRGGPADAAGLRAGDIVTEFDSERFTTPAQFTRLVRDTAPGRSVRVTFWRDGRFRETAVTPTR